MKCVHYISKGKYDWKITFCRPKPRWKYYIFKIDLKETAVQITVW